MLLEISSAFCKADETLVWIRVGCLQGAWYGFVDTGWAIFLSLLEQRIA